MARYAFTEFVLRFALRPPLRPSVFASVPAPALAVEKFSASASALSGPPESGCVSSHNFRAATVGSIPDFRHHATSSPQPWTSRWWPRHKGTVNSSLTLRPSARLWLNADDGHRRAGDRKSGKVAWRRTGRGRGPEPGAAPAMPKRPCRSLVIATGPWAAAATAWAVPSVALNWRAPRLEPEPTVAGTGPSILVSRRRPHCPRQSPSACPGRPPRGAEHRRRQPVFVGQGPKRPQGGILAALKGI